MPAKIRAPGSALIFVPLRHARQPLGRATNSVLARAHDGDEVVAMPDTAARAAGGDRAGNVVAIDLAVGQSLSVFVSAAVRIRGSLTACRTGSEAAIDAIAV